MPGDPSGLILHMYPLSSYCWKALLALYETGTAFRTVQVDGLPELRGGFAPGEPWLRELGEALRQLLGIEIRLCLGMGSGFEVTA